MQMNRGIVPQQGPNRDYKVRGLRYVGIRLGIPFRCRPARKYRDRQFRQEPLKGPAQQRCTHGESSADGSQQDKIAFLELAFV